MKNNHINLLGWILFIISAVGFIISSIGSFWAMFGSIFFFVACFVFLIPFFRKKKGLTECFIQVFVLEQII